MCNSATSGTDRMLSNYMAGTNTDILILQRQLMSG